MPYKHFTSEQRNQLSILLRTKIKKKEIAKLLGKDRTTIWRERKKAETNGKYYARKSKRLAKEKRIKANTRFRKIENDKYLRRYIVKKLKKYWSPEQVAGRWNRYHKRKHIGKDTIYKFVYGKRKDLVKYLRCQKGKYRRRYGTRIREKQREALKKIRIDQRPEEAELRLKIGHWEGDTILGKDKQHILTHTERKSGLILADKLDVVTAEETREKRIAEYSEIYENPYCGAERGYIDDVIMPSDTRKVINRALDILEDKNKDNKAFNARPWRKYSNINL